MNVDKDFQFLEVFNSLMLFMFTYSLLQKPFFI